MVLQGMRLSVIMNLAKAEDKIFGVLWILESMLRNYDPWPFGCDIKIVQ